MPKERGSLLGMLRGDEPGLIARAFHNLSGGNEGDWGERCIAKLLKNRMAGAAIFQNVYVPINDRTTELDIVMVDRSGIYVFESKAFGGKIYGQLDHMNWVQYIGSQKNSFYNPVKQNDNHCRYLAKVLQVSREDIFSFVVFENRVDLSKISPLSGSSFVVCSRDNLFQALQGVLSARSPVLSKEQLQSIRAKLGEWSAPDAAVKEQHIQQVQGRMFGNVCPVCGKKLIERKGKYGTFIGCTGYPECSYTREK